MQGLGAAVADVLYMLVAALGLSAVTNALLQHRNEFQLVGGLFMMVAGLTTYFAKPATAEAKAARGTNLAGAFGSTLVLTLMNPSTIVSFLAILAAVGVNVSISLDSTFGGLAFAATFMSTTRCRAAYRSIWNTTRCTWSTVRALRPLFKVAYSDSNMIPVSF